ncbi:MAG TPA: DUF6262 family protein [Spirochaetales bacterium]|nr:DUF6262 family protein [Spirochaetales bacterium]HQK35131.1 DUF6262 family protein [Spirochaetales bacterium]
MGELVSALAQKQEIQRQKSINLVLRAITELNVEGYRIRIKDLIEHTGLSRSIFAKPHIRKILIDKEICKASPKADVEQKAPTNKSTRISNLEKKLRQKDEHIRRLIAENDKLKEECALLRGKLFLLMQR